MDSRTLHGVWKFYALFKRGLVQSPYSDCLFCIQQIKGIEYREIQ